MTKWSLIFVCSGFVLGGCINTQPSNFPHAGVSLVPNFTDEINHKIFDSIPIPLDLNSDEIDAYKCGYKDAYILAMQGQYAVLTRIPEAYQSKAEAWRSGYNKGTSDGHEKYLSIIGPKNIGS